MWKKAATVVNRMEFHQKIKSGTAFSPSNPNSGNIYEGTQNTDFLCNPHMSEINR